MTDQNTGFSFSEIDFNPFEEDRVIEKSVVTNEPQREIWLSCMIGGDPASLAYNESVSLDLKGVFNFDFFKEAFENVVKRHEALRSTISADGENLIIYKDFPFYLEIEDIGGETVTGQKNILDSFISQEMRTPFDLKNGPLFRVHVHKLSDERHYFTLVIHHIVGDGWSIGIILEDLSKLYTGYVAGLMPVLADCSQISTYAQEQSDFINSEAFKKIENYWLNLYKGSVPILDLPTDFPRPLKRTYKAERIDRLLPKELVDLIKATGTKFGCSFVNTLLSAFEVFLYQQTRQKDIVVGLPFSGQSATGNFDLVGHCVNLLPLRSSIDPDIAFHEYLVYRKSVFFDAYDHQRFSFGQLIKNLNIKRDYSRVPLVPVVFNIDMGMDKAVYFGGLQHHLISNPREYETFELFLNATESKDGFSLECTYNTQLFKAATIRRMMNEFELLLQNLSHNPQLKLKDSLPSDEVDNQKLILSTTNETHYFDKNISQIINDIANQYPNKIAVSFRSEILTYKDLIKKSNQLASFLIEKGIKPGNIIGLSADRSIKMLISLLAILKSGASYIPLDPEYPRERIEFMLEDSSAKMLLISKKHKNSYQIKAQEEVIIEEIWPQLSNYHDTDPDIRSGGNHLAYILYTSGSTGKPKGVKITHRNLINFLISMQAQPGITADDRLLAITTISFDIAGLELYLPLISGAEVIIADSEVTKDGRLLLDIIEERNVTIMQATPSTWQMMIDSRWQKSYPLKVLSGGEPLSRDLADKLLNRSAQLWNMYGPTETTVWSAIKQISSSGPVTIGLPINNTRIYIMDKQGKQLPSGTPGEIYIGGDGVANGYLNRDDLTAEKFIADPYSKVPGSKLYKTGDLGKMLIDGEFECLGRIDQQVKIRGHRIELGEIEAMLLIQDGIKQSIVLAREDFPSEKRLIAYVVPDPNYQILDPIIGDNPGASVSKNEIQVSKDIIKVWKENLNKTLPAYMIPEHFIILKSFPLTPNAKIDRNALPKPDLNPKRDFKNVQKLLPQTANEKLVADIWSDSLGLDSLNITDDFFELGGHSLLAVKVMMAIEKETGKRLPLATLFDNSTIEKLAKQLSVDQSEEPWEALVPIKTTGKKDPLFLIHGGGLNILLFKSISEYFDEDQPVYGIQALGLNKETEIPETLQEISKRYIKEILKVNPNGPYALAGYSLGGIIAFEIAKQLKEIGKEIKLLGMIDTYADAIQQENILVKLVKKLKRQFYKLPFFVRTLSNHPKEAVEYQVKFVKRKLKGIFFPEASPVKEIFTAQEKMVYETYDKAHDDYILTPLDVKVSLFRVEKRLYYLDDQIYLGWDKFAKNGVEIVKIPGDHKTFLYPPNNQKFASRLQILLNRQ